MAGVGTGFDNLISGVKNFLPAKTAGGVVTRLVEALMDPTIASATALHDTDEYLSFDPRLGRTRGAGAPTGPKSRTTFNDAIVFVVGGGSYVEYTDLLEYASRASSAPVGSTGYAAGPGRKRITYGSTEILRPSEFLLTLGTLARA